MAAIELAAGYPHKVQLIGDSTCEIARPTAGSTINVGHVRRAEEEIEDRMTGLFRTRLTRVTPEQQRLLASMAAVGTARSTGLPSPAELWVATTAVSRPRQQLIGGGYIEAAGHGKLRFTIPGSRPTSAPMVEVPDCWRSRGGGDDCLGTHRPFRSPHCWRPDLPRSPVGQQRLGPSWGL